MSQALPFVADALVVMGVLVMSLGVFGIFRMPDVYTRLHAASKSVVLGVIALALASIVTGEAAIVWRVLLIAAVLLLTTPVSAHAIARAAFVEGERMKTSGAIDESGHGLQPDGAADETADDGSLSR